jgi:2-keto-4-pentenoate hydratase/2-oxohepta-3-ene-1,7-dioic acid hydratase in catechol pathway
MRIVRISTEGGSRYGVLDGEMIAVGEDPIGDIAHVLVDTKGFGEWATRGSDRIALADARLLAPIAEPPQFIGVGLNYRDHALESGMPIPEAPITFGFWSNSICGPDEPILLPPFATQVDWEAELAVVIGRPGENIPLDQAMDHVAGFTVVNDVSERKVQSDEGQWGRSKSFNNFKPMGPWITTTDDVGDGSGLRIQLWVNDQLKQSSTTDELVFTVAELVSRLSSSVTLRTGAVISTGTPPGVGHARQPPEYLHHGDEVRIVIERVGELRNPVVGVPHS